MSEQLMPINVFASADSLHYKEAAPWNFYRIGRKQRQHPLEASSCLRVAILSTQTEGEGRVIARRRGANDISIVLDQKYTETSANRTSQVRLQDLSP
jgi:hypothetical protein